MWVQGLIVIGSLVVANHILFVILVKPNLSPDTKGGPPAQGLEVRLEKEEIERIGMFKNTVIASLDQSPVDIRPCADIACFERVTAS